MQFSHLAGKCFAFESKNILGTMKIFACHSRHPFVCIDLWSVSQAFTLSAVTECVSVGETLHHSTQTHDAGSSYCVLSCRTCHVEVSAPEPRHKSGFWVFSLTMSMVTLRSNSTQALVEVSNHTNYFRWCADLLHRTHTSWPKKKENVQLFSSSLSDSVCVCSYSLYDSVKKCVC